MKASIKRQDVRLINKTSPSLLTRFFVVKSRPTKLDSIRVAFAFPSRLGNSVSRNRIKRRIRETAKTLSFNNKFGTDLFFIARKSLCDLTNIYWQKEKVRIKEWFEIYQSTNHISH